MNLAEVLQSNGTGLLEGLCRPHDRETTFEKIEDKYPRDIPLTEINFSLGIHNLGKYPVEVSGTGVVEFDSKGWEAKITLDEGIIYLMIDFSRDTEFGKFRATLLKN